MPFYRGCDAEVIPKWTGTMQCNIAFLKTLNIVSLVASENDDGDVRGWILVEPLRKKKKSICHEYEKWNYINPKYAKYAHLRADSIATVWRGFSLVKPFFNHGPAVTFIVSNSSHDHNLGMIEPLCW